MLPFLGYIVYDVVLMAKKIASLQPNARKTES